MDRFLPPAIQASKGRNRSQILRVKHRKGERNSLIGIPLASAMAFPKGYLRPHSAKLDQTEINERQRSWTRSENELMRKESLNSMHLFLTLHVMSKRQKEGEFHTQLRSASWSTSPPIFLLSNSAGLWNHDPIGGGRDRFKQSQLEFESC